MEEFSKKPCALVIRMQDPLQTLQAILKLFLDRAISVSTLHLQCLKDMEGILIIHCAIERDRIKYSANLIEKVKGVIELELLESKGSNLVKN